MNNTKIEDVKYSDVVISVYTYLVIEITLQRQLKVVLHQR